MEQHRKAGLVQFVTKSQLSSPQICFTGETVAPSTTIVVG